MPRFPKRQLHLPKLSGLRSIRFRLPYFCAVQRPNSSIIQVIVRKKYVKFILCREMKSPLTLSWRSNVSENAFRLMHVLAEKIVHFSEMFTILLNLSENAFRFLHVLPEKIMYISEMFIILFKCGT